MKENIRAGFIVCLLCTILMGCKNIVRISATGDASSPTFMLGDEGIPVSSLEVVRYCIENGQLGSKQMWMLDRVKKPIILEKVVYGQVPTGFSESLRSSSLHARDFYSIEVAGLRNDASGFFVLDMKSGGVIIVNIEDFNNMSLLDWLESKRSVYNISCNPEEK